MVVSPQEDLCEGKDGSYNWCGRGGFFPFGFNGVISGAASAFYGFVGFDVIATMGEEVGDDCNDNDDDDDDDQVIDPQKMMPVAIILSLTIIFLAYFGLSAVVTLMLPYFLQVMTVMITVIMLMIVIMVQDAGAPIPHIFSYVGWEWAAWIVRVGALMGLTARYREMVDGGSTDVSMFSLLGGIVPLPRVLWAMASDGLLFKPFSKVHPKYKTPMVATLFSGFLFGKNNFNPAVV